MRETERESGKFPSCGYGVMGLCCSSCLLGPCRITPFERDSAKVPCGDNADIVVAKNLLRLVGVEAASGLKNLNERLRKLGSSVSSRPTGKVSADVKLKDIAEKYGVAPRVTAKRFIHYLMEESERLLYPLPDSENPSTLLSSLYPEGPFPHIHRNVLLPNSLTSLIFETLSNEQKESIPVEGILWRCLRTSMLTFICEELCRDIDYLNNGKWLRETEGEALDVLEHLPPNPLPVVVYLSRDESPHKESMSRTAGELKQAVEGNLLHVRIRDINMLPHIARRFFQEWSLSAAEVGAIAVAFSQSAASALGALVFGFTVISFPPLPIHGSEVVEKFLREDLQEKLGSVYLPPRAGEVLPVILELLRGRA